MSFSLSAAQIASFQTDFVLDVFIDGGKVSQSGALESYFIDFSSVSVQTDDTTPVPEPSSIMGLIALGIFGANSLRRR
ncbi:MAG: PEP-CTERM sorting domain-containing protein [Symploca sp. SIO2C1]|nr:PEP-CTERM sorting domain-containing protein [Symploca sp. SIO2C1]